QGEIGGKTGDDDGYVSGLTGEYFEGHDRDPDKLKLKRVDPDVFFDWGNGQPSPEVRRDNFSARWTGEIMAPADGQYVFHIDYDDGFILAIDGKTIGEIWEQTVGSLSCEVDLRAGWREIRLDYKEHGGGAYVKVEWQGPGFARCRVPGTVLRTRAP
ncbi:MAG: PA14 domain-containing protein, partial [Planctomycetota bacterium]